MPNAPHAPTTPPTTWAEVRAHDHVTRYRRAGAGRTVVVLDLASEPPALWPELADRLAGSSRVIRPEVPAGDVASWLTEFLEGLGTAGVGLVAADPFCIGALELTLLDAEQVTRLVLVPGGPAGGMADGLDAALATRARRGAVPLLVVRRGLPAAEALPLVARFLTGDARTSPTG